VNFIHHCLESPTGWATHEQDRIAAIIYKVGEFCASTRNGSAARADRAGSKGSPRTSACMPI
jgi:hypothetical protein